MTAARIVALAEATGWLEPLAIAHHAAWHDLFGAQWTLDVVRGELRDSQGAEGVPVTWVALERDALIGSVSLLAEDAPELQHFGSPWLGNLWVDPAWRGQGWGRRLVKHAVEAAAAQQVPRLLLFTPEHAAYYLNLGWSQLAEASLAGRRVDVMRCEPGARAQAAA